MRHAFTFPAIATVPLAASVAIWSAFASGAVAPEGSAGRNVAPMARLSAAPDQEAAR